MGFYESSQEYVGVYGSFQVEMGEYGSLQALLFQTSRTGVSNRANCVYEQLR